MYIDYLNRFTTEINLQKNKDKIKAATLKQPLIYRFTQKQWNKLPKNLNRLNQIKWRARKMNLINKIINKVNNLLSQSNIFFTNGFQKSLIISPKTFLG